MRGMAYSRSQIAPPNLLRSEPPTDMCGTERHITARRFQADARDARTRGVSLICTDKSVGYKHLKKDFLYATTDHAIGQYVCGAVHTQTIQGFWSIFKHGVVGTFHNVSAKYLPLYVAEFQFRYNNHVNSDIFGETIRGC
jgi:hypothetical protein